VKAYVVQLREVPASVMARKSYELNAINGGSQDFNVNLGSSLSPTTL
jgi:hypothetical protein